MATDRVLITGTTSGIGAGLLEHYAARGARIVAVNRRPVPELEARFPDVRFACVDVRAADQVARLVDELARAGELPSLFLLNAGINRIDNDEGFDLAAFEDVVATNLYGALSFVAPLARLPPDGFSRHLVAIGSMAALVGNPYGVGYHASKKALAACFATWSRMYAGTDLVFQRVVLGPSRTPMYSMASRLPAWMGRVRDGISAPLDGAVRAIAGFATTRKPSLLYPRRAIPLYSAMWLGQTLVPGFFQGRKTLAGDARRTAPDGRPAGGDRR
jgi:NAD(P)-dependent dehydrogenase (short-subunit alcohol dehydrogenase family)